MNADPRDVIASSAMSRLQIIAVAVCVFLNGLDGFDVLAISFASPGIAAEWGIERGALGIVLSMELIGMAIGSVTLGGMADRFGRRPTILACLIVMSAGMLAAAFANTLVLLSLVRFITGLGIGGMLAAISAMTAEFSNAQRRNLCVAVMATGYPLGVIIGGSVASMLLAQFDWRAVFFFGAAVTALFIPLSLIFLPESVSYLAMKRPANALERINHTLRKMKKTPVEALPPVANPVKSKVGLSKLFAPDLRHITLLLTLAYFTHIMTFYYILKWIPKIVADMGFDPSLAGSVLVWANVGGASGALILSLLTQVFDIRKLVVLALMLASVMVAVFGFADSNLGQLSLLAALAGICTNSAIVGMYALFVQYFPTEVRAGGTGFVIGVGRGGAALGPIVAGFLFEFGHGLPSVSFFMGLGSLVAAAALIVLMRLGGQREAPAHSI